MRLRAWSVAGLFVASLAFLGGCSKKVILEQQVRVKNKVYLAICYKQDDKTYLDIKELPDTTRFEMVAVDDCVDVRNVVQTAKNHVNANLGNGGASFPSSNKRAAEPSPRAYLLDVHAANQVRVLDTGTNSLAGSVLLPGGYPLGLGITPDNRFVWVLQDAILPGAIATPLPPRVNIIDTAALAITGTINLPAGVIPVGVAFTPDGKFAYVANYGSESYANNQDFAHSSMLVIDTQTRAVVATIPTPGGAGPTVITPDGQVVYTLGLTNAITAIDTNTNTVSQSFPSAGVTALVMHPNGSRLYAAPATGKTSGVMVVDTASNAVVTTIPLVLDAGAPFFNFSTITNLGITEEGSIVTVFQRGTGKLSTIDTTTNTVVNTIAATNGLSLAMAFVGP